MAKVRMTPSEAIVETLVAEGVDHVSGIAGSAFMDMLDLFPAAGIRTKSRWGSPRRDIGSNRLSGGW
jgi:hypothetical protein